MNIGELTTALDLAEAVEAMGFLPFFKNAVAGFSVDEHTPRNLWFVAGVDGPWEWKGPAVRTGKCAYGKFFRGKAGYIGLDWLPDFINYRRNGYDYDALYDDGLMPHSDKQIMDVLTREGALLSTELKEKSGYGRNGKKGFDPIITRLQMQCYVTVADFEYAKDKFGNPYGWGIAKYATPEQVYGGEFVRSAYSRPPKESFERIVEHLKIVLPGVDENKIIRLMRL